MTGRPRDPHVTDRVLTVATEVLATRGLVAFTADEVAASAGVGKASIYRRWRTMTELLVAVVEQLGIRELDYGGWDAGLSTTREDLLRLLTAATTGTSALAEGAVLSQVGIDEKLRQAYARGPVVHFFRACEVARGRARQRGEQWPTLDPVLVGWTSLIYRVATTGAPADPALVEDTVDRVVLPALRAGVPA